MTPSPYRQPGRTSRSPQKEPPVRPPFVAVFAMIAAVALVVILNRASERDREKMSGGVQCHVTLFDVMLNTDPR